MDTVSIYALATKCSELFSRWRNSVSTLPNEVMQVENLLFRFNLWAENNSANSEGRDSLDWRLRKSPLPHDVIVDLLEALSAVILRNLAPEKPGAAEHESADALLDQLFRFTRAIRRSGALKRFVRVADHVEYDKDVNLTLKFRECVMPYLDVVLKSTSQELKNRLLDTICLRQQNFAYLRSRRKTTKEIVSPAPQTSGSQTGSRLGSTYSSKGRSTSQSQSQGRQQRGIQGPRASANKRRGGPPSATTFNTSLLPTIEGPLLEQSHAEFALEDLPRRPKLPPDPRHKELECPYCFLVCDRAEFTDAGWPRHIIQDLMPFICVHESCHIPNTLYDSTAAWMSHMRTEHAPHGWICMDRSHTSSVPFSNMGEFRQHMREHEDDLTEDELDDIVEESYGILPSGDVFDGCPFCEEYINEPPERFDLVHHVSSHLLELSKISLSGHEFDGHMKADSESNHTTGQGHIASAAASTQKSKRSPDSHSFSINMDVDNDRDEEPDKQESMEHDNDSSPFEEREVLSSNPGDWKFLESRRLAYDPVEDTTIARFTKAMLKRDPSARSSREPTGGHRQAHDGLNEATAVEEPALSEGRIRILGDVEANSSAEDGPSPSHRVPRFVVAIHVGAAYSSVAYADLDEPFKDHLITDWGAGPPVEQVRTALFYRDITTSGPPSATRTRSEVESWSPDDVVDWLSLKRVGPHQTQVFRDHNISGEMLLGMDQSSLFNKALDLGDVGGRWDLWYSIKALQDEVNSHPSLWINSTHGGEAFLVEDLGLAPDAEPPALQTYFKLGFFPGAESRLLGSRFETKYTEKALPIPREECLRLMTDYLKRLKRTIDQVIYADAAMVSAQVDYILTVPEDWTNSARESLGRCATEAHIGNEHARQSLHYVAEPEALMAYIASSTPHLGLHKDDVFLVCDAGGCQVTVSTYVVLSMSSIRHTLRRNYADSGLCGDILLDRGFEDYLMSMNYINCKDESEQRLMSRALAHFRSKIKPSFTGMETTPFHITLTEDSAPGHARIFKMPVDDIRNKVFDPVITKVCNLVSHHLHLVDFGKLAVFEDKSGPVKALYLAGGFGQNEYLKRRLQMTVGDEIRVIRVENGRTAVVRGALIHGKGMAQRAAQRESQPPTVTPVDQGPRVTAHVATRHYGIRRSVRYDPDNPVHANNADRVTRYAGSSSLEVMDWFVKKGERLLEDEPVKFSLMYEIDTREGHELRSITCNIYSSMAEIPPQFLPTAAHPVPDLKLIVTLSIDLNALPPDHVSKHGSRSIVDFDVYMTLRSSEVVFAVGSRDFRLPVAIL